VIATARSRSQLPPEDAQNPFGLHVVNRASSGSLAAMNRCRDIDDLAIFGHLAIHLGVAAGAGIGDEELEHGIFGSSQAG
jgi:hypothetical protein